MSFRAKSSADFGSGSSGTLAVPAGTASGDAVVGSISADGSGLTLSFSGGSSWSSLTRIDITNGDAQSFQVFYKSAGGSEGANYTWNNSGGNACSVGVAAYQNVDAAVLDGAVGTATSANNPNSASPPSSPISATANAVTTASANADVLAWYTVDINGGVAGTWGAPSGTTARISQNPAQFSNLLMVDFTQVSAGSTGSKVATFTAAGNAGNPAAYMLALKAAGGGGGAADESIANRPFVFDPQPEDEDDGAWQLLNQGAQLDSQISSGVGAYTWAGTTASTSQLINATPAAWSWAATTAVTSQLVNAAAGAWSWVGTTSGTSQLISASPAAYTWSGTTTGTSQLVSASPGAYSWAATTASTTQLINSDGGPTAWTWSGTTSTLGASGVNATPGAYAWSGTTAWTSQLLNASPGTYSWAGTTAAFSQLISATPGAWTWGGGTASTTQLINSDGGASAWFWAGTTASLGSTIVAIPGAWSWSGTTATVPAQIAATPGLLAWAGTLATIPSAGGGTHARKRYQIKVGKQVFEGSKEAVEQIARDLAIEAIRDANQEAPQVAEIVVPSKRKKPAIVAATQDAKAVQAAYFEAMRQEIQRQQDEEEEALLALLT